MDRGPAYRSHLRIDAAQTAGTDPAWPHGPWQSASAVTDTTEPELAGLRRRVVDPVVASLFRADELESVVVFANPGSRDIRATVTVRGEESMHYLSMRRSPPMGEDEVAGVPGQFASELEDFVA